MVGDNVLYFVYLIVFHESTSFTEREYSQQPLESDDKLLKRLKRRLSTSDSINQAAVIPEKRERTEL